jgi:hypothetical protein
MCSNLQLPLDRVRVKPRPFHSLISHLSRHISSFEISPIVFDRSSLFISPPTNSRIESPITQNRYTMEDQLLSSNSELELAVIENLMSLRANVVDQKTVGRTQITSDMSKSTTIANAQHSHSSASDMNSVEIASAKSLSHLNYNSMFNRNHTASHGGAVVVPQQLHTASRSNPSTSGPNGNHYDMYSNLRAVSFDRGHPPPVANSNPSGHFHLGPNQGNPSVHVNNHHSKKNVVSKNYPQQTHRQYPYPMVQPYPIANSGSHSVASSSTPEPSFLDLSDEQMKELMGDTDLVKLDDRNYVPDYLFLSMAQLRPCELVESDRTGVYKARDVGFLGLCCKYCGGEPGKGRYFPQTIRSLSQTTTSATIAKHIAQKCRAMPSNIKNTVTSLKKEQDWLDKLAKDRVTNRYESRPKYGSRKVFFEQFWARLHGDNAPVSSPEHASDLALAPAVSADDEHPHGLFHNTTNTPNSSFSIHSLDGSQSSNTVSPDTNFSPTAVLKRKITEDDDSCGAESSNSDIENHLRPHKTQKMMPHAHASPEFA